MKESINITVDANQKKRLMEEAHKRNLSLREYLKLKISLFDGCVNFIKLS